MRLHLYLRMSRKDLENFRYRVDGLAIGQFVMVSVIPFAIILLLFVLGIDVIEWAFGPSGFWNQTTFIGFMATAFLPVFLAGMAFNALVLLAYALVRRIVHIRRYGIWNSPRNIARLLRSLENTNNELRMRTNGVDSHFISEVAAVCYRTEVMFTGMYVRDVSQKVRQEVIDRLTTLLKQVRIYCDIRQNMRNHPEADMSVIGETAASCLRFVNERIKEINGAGI